MNPRTMVLRLLLLFALVLGSLSTLWTRPVPLGYQLQGGTRVVMKVDLDFVEREKVQQDLDALGHLYKGLRNTAVERSGRSLLVAGEATPPVIEYLLRAGYQLVDSEEAAQRLVLTPVRRSAFRQSFTEELVRRLAVRYRTCPGLDVELIEVGTLALTMPVGVELFQCASWAPPGMTPLPATYWLPRYGEPSTGWHDHCAPGFYAADPDHRRRMVLSRAPTC